MKFSERVATFISFVLLLYIGLALYCNFDLDCMFETAEGIKTYIYSFVR